MEIRVIREQAEEEDPSLQKDALLEQIAQLPTPQNLLAEMKSTELSLHVESLTEVLKGHHESFEASIRRITKRQTAIIKQLKGIQVDPSLGKMDSDTARLLKKVEEFEEVRQETYKYRMLVDMMKQTLAHIEDDVDKLIDARVKQLDQQLRDKAAKK